MVKFEQKLIREFVKLASPLTVRGFAALSQAVLAFVVLRVSGPESLGFFYIFLSLTQISANVLNLGLPDYALRTVAALEAKGASTTARRLVPKLIVTATLPLAVVAFPLIEYSDFLAVFVLKNGALGFVFPLLLVSIAVFSALRIVAQSLKAREKTSFGLATEFLIAPILLVLALTIAGLSGVRPTVQILLVLFIASNAAAALIGALVLYRRWTEPGTTFHRLALGQFRGIWFGAMIQGLFLNLPVLVLPQFASPEEIAVFGLAMRLAGIVGSILDAVISLYAPQFSRSFALQDWRELRRGFRRSQISTFALSLPFVVIGFALPETILGLFSKEMTSGAHLLEIILLGRLIQAACGPVSIYLWMTKNEASEIVGTILGIAVTGVLSVLLGPTLGAFGIAIASTTAYGVRNGTQYAKVTNALRKQINT